MLAIGLVSRCFCARTERASSCQTQALCADCMFAAAQYPASRARLLNEQHGGLNAHELLGPFTEPAGARLAVDDAVWEELDGVLRNFDLGKVPLMIGEILYIAI